MNANNVNDRLDQSSHGTPQVDPDQQRRYLGTFRERVSLGIKIKDTKNPWAVNALKKDIKAHPSYTILINEKIGDAMGTYMQIANQSHVNFDLKTDYSDNPNWYGILYISPKTAINQSPIEWNHKYPIKKSNHHNEQAHQASNHNSLWNKIKTIFKK